MVKKENNYAFIDSQNLNLGVKADGWNLDWRKFRQYLKQKYNVNKAFIFIGFLQSNNQLYDQLQSAGFVLIFKQILVMKDGRIKGNVDAELVLHTMINIDKFDKAVIVSNDGDFLCLVQWLEENKKLKKLMTPNKHYSKLYKGYEKYMSNISSLRRSLEHQSSKKSNKKARSSGRPKS